MISDYRYETKKVIALQYKKRMAVPFRDQRSENSDSVYLKDTYIWLDNLGEKKMHSIPYCQYT